MKKALCTLLTLIVTTVCLSGCSGHPVTKTANVEGAIFAGSSDDKIPVEVKFDIGWLTGKNNQKYNPDLAQFCALLSADTYFREKDYEKQRQNRVLFNEFNEPDYDFTSFLSQVGFTEVEHYESYLYQENPTDSNDSVTLTIGHQTVSGKCDVYAVAVRGCFSAQEWRSAFDPGCADASYEELTGNHPEWTDKDHFKGVDIASDRALSYIKDFMENNGDTSLPDRILITGHSRGGGIANLLGAYFEDCNDITSYTYTFNAMGVTVSDDTANYKSIFNIFDSEDLFTNLFPFANGSFERYGTNMTVSVASSNELRSSIATLKGRDDYKCISSDMAEQYSLLFAERFPDRDMLCKKESITRTYVDKEEAEKARDEMIKTISSEEGLGLDGLCSVGEIAEESDGSYSLTIEYCGEALLQTYAMVMAYGEAAYTPAVNLFAEDKTGCEIAELLLNNSSDINGAHLLINGYMISGTFK